MAALATAGFAGASSLPAFGGQAATAEHDIRLLHRLHGAATAADVRADDLHDSAADRVSPAPDTRPPGSPKHLHAVTNMPGAITLRWVLPHAADLARIVVRRGRGAACPASAAGGVPVGGTAPRAEQTDTSEVDTHTYCYAVFAYDGRGTARPPPSPATSATPATSPRRRPWRT